jgi:hypothetical protein
VLPDFLSIKKDLSESRFSSFSSNLFGDPVLSKIPRYKQHEGDRFTIFRDDGSQATSDQKEIRSDPVTIDLKEVHKRGERAIFDSIVEARRQIAATGRRMIVEKIEQESPSMNAQGRPFTAEIYLEMLESLFFSFDEHGNWEEPDFWQEYPNPKLLERVRSERRRFEVEPELREKLDSIISSKRQEWNDREANRKLVD